MSQNYVPPGWYPDPSRPMTQRYWDGTSWTENYAPLPTHQAAQAPSTNGIEWIGFLAAPFLPPVGFIIGLFLIGKSNAAAMMVGLSVFWSIGWALVLAFAV